MTTNTTVSKDDTFIVHKEGEQGTITVHRLDGRIMTPLDDRPDWAEGLTTALVQERVTWYEKRLGKDSEAFKTINAHAEAVEFSDLGWLGVDAQQGELEVRADASYRTELVAKILGIDTDADAKDNFNGKALAEAEASRMPSTMSREEHAALEDSIKTGFGSVEAEAAEDRQAATNR